MRLVLSSSGATVSAARAAPLVVTSHVSSGCRKNHLIADNLGWFQDGGTNIEQIMQEKGLAVTRVNDALEECRAEHQNAHVLLPQHAEDNVFEALGEPVAKK
jgi:hypothetical protein